MKSTKGFKSAATKKTTRTGAPKSPEPSPKSSARPVTIEAKIDVGFGNAVFVRGQGRGLSWERGVPLTCIDGQTWRWCAESDEKLVFKLLLNDNVWSQGNDLSAAPGERVEVAPTF